MKLLWDAEQKDQRPTLSEDSLRLISRGYPGVDKTRLKLSAQFFNQALPPRAKQVWINVADRQRGRQVGATFSINQVRPDRLHRGYVIETHGCDPCCLDGGWGRLATDQMEASLSQGCQERLIACARGEIDRLDGFILQDIRGGPPFRRPSAARQLDEHRKGIKGRLGLAPQAAEKNHSI